MEMGSISSRIRENSADAAKHASYYDQFWQIEKVGIGGFQTVRAELIKKAIQNYTSKSEPRILDFGCGYGWLSVFLADLGQYTGVDFSAKAIDFARCAYHRFGEFHLAESDDLCLGLGDKPFDVIVASEVIEHVADHSAFVEQLQLMLSEEGILIITTPNGSLFELFVRKYGRENLQPVENWLIPDQLRSLLSLSFVTLCHEGILYRKPMYSLRARLISTRLMKLARRLRVGAAYDRLLLNIAIYQFAVFMKRPAATKQAAAN